MKGSCVKCPQQSNFSDCGIYVLQYAESFFTVSVNLLISLFLHLFQSGNCRQHIIFILNDHRKFTYLLSLVFFTAILHLFQYGCKEFQRQQICEFSVIV